MKNNMPSPYTTFENNNNKPTLLVTKSSSSSSTSSTRSTTSASNSLKPMPSTDLKIKSSLGGMVSPSLPVDENKKKNKNSVRSRQTMSSGYPEDEDEAWVPSVRIKPEFGVVPPFILSADQMQQLAIHVLPKTVSHCPWKRLYSLARDGDSFVACSASIRSEPRSLLVVKTTRGAIFGGYAASPWNNQCQGAPSFYGSAQACLYSFACNNGNNHSEENADLKVYRWSGANRYIQLCDLSQKMLAFGGGGAHGMFGLCVEEDFQKGSTGHCDTFNNAPLCDQENFSILDLEIWGMVTGVF